MSSIKLSPNPSGAGIFTVAAPNSASNYTLTLPTETGTILSNAGPFTANASASNGAVTIDASNNVGIGTSSPAGADGLAAVVYNGGGAARLALKNNSTGNAAGDGFQLAVSGTTAYIEQREAASLVFTTDNTERARIDSSGNLLVGTTGISYGEKFAVVASGASANNAYFLYNSTDDRSSVIVRHLRASGSTGATMLDFLSASGASVGTIRSNGTVTAYNTSSDYRLKHDIAPMTGALAKIAALKPVTYKWNADDSDGEGFIAHELAEVVPQCVSGEKDAVDAEGKPVYQGIDTSFLVATLTAAIQEQQALIESLTARIAALEAA